MLTFLCTQHMALAKSNECIWRFCTQLTLGCRQTGNSITNYRWNETVYRPIKYNDIHISPVRSISPTAQQPNNRNQKLFKYSIFIKKKKCLSNLINNQIFTLIIFLILDFVFKINMGTNTYGSNCKSSRLYELESIEFKS